MTKIEVQIYEIQDPREAETMVELGVDRLGSVVVSEHDWKRPAVTEAIRVSQEAGLKHSLIPLFSIPQKVFQTIEYYRPDIIHFCDSLTGHHGRILDCQNFIALQQQIRERFPGIEIMRSVPVAPRAAGSTLPTLEIARSFEGSTDYFLTDTALSTQPVDGYIGITGIPGDWDVAGKLVNVSSIPVILAGGLSPENVYEAIMNVRPFGVDSCTGTNLPDRNGRPIRFKKDRGRVQAFVHEARRAEKDLCGLQTSERGRN